VSDADIDSDFEDHDPLEGEPPPATAEPVVVPRWVQLVMLPISVLALWVVARAAGPVLLIFIALLGIQSARSAFRNARNPYYTSVSPQARLALFGAWLGLVLYLGVMTLQSESLFLALAR